jgi:hypothetical protein
LQTTPWLRRNCGFWKDFRGGCRPPGLLQTTLLWLREPFGPVKGITPMLNPDQINTIHRLHGVEKWSLRKIAAHLPNKSTSCGSVGFRNFDSNPHRVIVCNRYKGSNIASVSLSGGLVPLFNPRLDQWSDHFRLNGAVIETARFDR